MNTLAEIAIVKFSSFDGLEYKTGRFLNRQFPVHFHQEWSLALIESGSEIITVNHIDLPLYAGALILIPPFIPHANRGNQDELWQYRALYLNEDVTKFILQLKGISYQKALNTSYTIIYDPETANNFKSIYSLTSKQQNCDQIISGVFTQFFGSEYPAPTGKANGVNLLTKELISFLGKNFRNKVTLGELSSTYKIDKFKLIRNFKHATGLSPYAYITSLRVEYAKKQLFTETSLAEVALDAGFYDQSHFSHCFKRFVGLSPQAYRSNCNILQDTA